MRTQSIEDSLFKKCFYEVVNCRVYKIICYSVVVRSVNTIEMHLQRNIQAYSSLCTVESSLKFMIFNTLQSSGHYMYRQFNIEQFYVLPTQCVYVFCVDLRTNSGYFPIQH